MSTVEEIRTAIQKLSLEERAQITAELCGWTDDEPVSVLTISSVQHSRR
ncbi:MAG: hypothetical protein ACLQU3_29040 [Limisphaerales bacterium]